MSESPEITTKVSPHSVVETVARLVEMVEARGMKVFAVIDQAAEAELKLDLPNSKTVGAVKRPCTLPGVTSHRQ